MISKIGKKAFPIFFAIFIMASAYGQESEFSTSEVGISVGGMNYTGDLSPFYNIKSIRQSAYIYYRHNFDPGWSLKVALHEGQFLMRDSYRSTPMSEMRNTHAGSFILEVGAFIEHNFLDFRNPKRNNRLAPYFTAGIAGFNYNLYESDLRSSGSNFSIAIPFGVGVKYQVSRKINFQWEFVARKTFVDDLDGIEDLVLENGKHASFPFENDWYYYTGIGLSYSFHSVTCPQNYVF